MMRISRALTSAIAVGISLWAGAVRGQAVHTIALKGQHAPGTANGVEFTGFGVPQLQSTGQVVFSAALTGEGIGCTYKGTVCNFGGLWTGDAASIALVMRGGDQAPGFPAGVRFGSVYPEPNLTVSSNGPIAFQAGAFESNGNGHYGVWAGSVGSFSLAFLSGDHAPDTAPEFVLGGFDGPGHFIINSSGQSVLSAQLASTLGYDPDDDGIWSSRSGTMALVARVRNHAPGMPADVYFDGVGGAALNSSGYVVFSSVLTGGGFGYLHNTGIWSDRTGAVALIASADQHAPGTDSGVLFRGVGAYPQMDAAGHVAFNGWLNGLGVTAANDSGVWSDISGSMSLVVRTGEHAPGTASGVNFKNLGEHALFSSSGKIAFTAGLTGPGVDSTNDSGIWSNTSGAFNPVMRIGDPAPGVSGKVFGSFGDTFLNDAGQVAFQSYLTDPGVAFNWTPSAIDGLWAQDSAGILHLIVRDGGQIEVTPGDTRTVASFEYIDEGLNGDGSPFSFNGRGQFAFLARFTDGTSGIFISEVAAVPEPSCLGLLLAASFACCVMRRRVMRSGAAYVSRGRVIAEYKSTLQLGGTFYPFQQRGESIA